MRLKQECYIDYPISIPKEIQPDTDFQVEKKP